MKQLTSIVFRLAAIVSGVASTCDVPFTDSNELQTVMLQKVLAPAKVFTSCTKDNTVALTFDDGPYIYEDALVSYLNKENIKATFFLNGKNWGCIYDHANVEALQRTLLSGHQIASHTWAHAHLTTLSRTQLDDDINKTNLAIRRILGRVPAFMRPPYGEYNNDVLEALAAHNQTAVTWDFDSGDSSTQSVEQQKKNYDNIANQKPKNILTLNHETHESTVKEVIPHAVSVLKAKGYTFATVAECLGLPEYVWSGAPEARTSEWVC